MTYTNKKSVSYNGTTTKELKRIFFLNFCPEALNVSSIYWTNTWFEMIAKDRFQYLTTKQTMDVVNFRWKKIIIAQKKTLVLGFFVLKFWTTEKKSNKDFMCCPYRLLIYS